MTIITKISDTFSFNIAPISHLLLYRGREMKHLLSFYIINLFLNPFKAAKREKSLNRLLSFIETLNFCSRQLLPLLKQSFVSLYHYLDCMSTEPIIIEEPSIKTSTKANQNLKEQTFFKIMDEIEEYDSLSTSVRHKYQEAMLSLASIKFQNPYALNVNAHRCTPAFLKLSQNQTLQYSYSQFTNPVSEDQVYPDEYEQQLQIQKQCLQKQETLNRLVSKADKQNLCQKQLFISLQCVEQPRKGDSYCLQIQRDFVITPETVRAKEEV